MGMTFDPPKCPECGQEPAGTLEAVQGCAEFEKEEDGSYEYSGHTNVFWDGQETVERSGKTVLVCPDGEEWEATTLAE